MTGVEHSLRQELVYRAHILGESIQDPAAGIGIKEAHARAYEGAKDKIVEPLTAAEADVVEGERTHDADYENGKDDDCVDVDVVVDLENVILVDYGGALVHHLRAVQLALVHVFVVGARFFRCYSGITINS